jgi:hypothetical protein
MLEILRGAFLNFEFKKLKNNKIYEKQLSLTHYKPSFLW